MKLADKIFSIQPEFINEDNAAYAEYRTSVGHFNASTAVLVGGLASRYAGIETGFEPAEIVGDVAAVVGVAATYASGLAAMVKGFPLIRR